MSFSFSFLKSHLSCPDVSRREKRVGRGCKGRRLEGKHPGRVEQNPSTDLHKRRVQVIGPPPLGPENADHHAIRSNGPHTSTP